MSKNILRRSKKASVASFLSKELVILLKMSKKIDFGEGLSAEAKAWKTVWSAGQGVATIDDVVSVQTLVASLKAEFKAAIQAQAKLLDQYS